MSSQLSVIIVNYRAGELLRASLVALRAQLPGGSEVIVVDNDPSDDGSDGLEDVLPGTYVIRNSLNAGYGRASNQALRIATGDRVLFLNPDAIIQPGAIATASQFLDAHPDVGILGARVLLPDGKLDPAARRSFKTPGSYLYKAIGLSRLFPRNARFGRYYLSYLDPTALTDIDATVGAFMFARRTAIEGVGGFDERFFMYCEDEDLCWRVKMAGWRVVYHPGVVVRHHKGTSTRQRRARMVFHFHRSLFLYHRKNVAPRYPALVNVGIYAGILASLALKLPFTVVRSVLAGRGPLRGRAS